MTDSPPSPVSWATQIHVWVISEHDEDDNDSEVKAVIHDDSEVALAALWDVYHQAWAYANVPDEVHQPDDRWYEEHANQLTIADDDTAQIRFENQIWTAWRLPIQ